MTKAERADHVLRRLAELYPDPPIPLDHTDAFTLLIAVLLSAQCTDIRVNQITPKLFGELGRTPQALAKQPVPASEAIGTTLNSDNAGRFGRLACFGFWTNRAVTTGEGGMIVTHDDRLAKACRAIRQQGRVDRMSFAGQSRDLGSLLECVSSGYDARMPEMCAALGVGQIRRLDETINRRHVIAGAYMRRLAANPDVLLPTVPEGSTVSWANFVVRLSSRFTSEDRDAVIAVLHRQDVGAANYYPALHLLPHSRAAVSHEPGDFPVAENAAARTIALPFFNRMTEDQVDTVCSTLEVALQRVGGVGRPPA